MLYYYYYCYQVFHSFFTKEMVKSALVDTRQHLVNSLKSLQTSSHLIIKQKEAPYVYGLRNIIGKNQEKPYSALFLFIYGETFVKIVIPMNSLSPQFP